MARVAMELPNQAGSAGKYLKTDGANATWEDGGGSGGGQVNSVVAGTGITVDNTDPVNPVVTNTNPTPYTLPTATDTILGGVKIGSRLTINEGVLSADVQAGGGDVLAPATNTDSYIPQWDGANSKTLKNGLAVPNGGLAGLTAPTFATSITGSYLTASEILITDADKKIVSAPVATYPSLTELSYVKGVTSAIQTQLGGKASLTGAETLTNKIIPPRLVTAASYTTDTGSSLDVSTCDQFEVTAQAGALKFNNPGGSPTGGRRLIIRIKDNGTARALTYDTQFRAMGTALPTTTVLSKTLYMGFIYNATDTKWDLVAAAQEA